MMKCQDTRSRALSLLRILLYDVLLNMFMMLNAADVVSVDSEISRALTPIASDCNLEEVFVLILQRCSSHFFYKSRVKSVNTVFMMIPFALINNVHASFIYFCFLFVGGLLSCT